MFRKSWDIRVTGFTILHPKTYSQLLLPSDSARLQILKHQRLNPQDLVVA